jgi:hypothetical protein
MWTVVMPIIHDQHDNADRLQYMHMTTDSVSIATLFPKRKRLQKESTGPPGKTIEVEELKLKLKLKLRLKLDLLQQTLRMTQRQR